MAFVTRDKHVVVPRFLGSLSAFLRLGRPLFLTGGVLLNALGAAIALYNGAPFNVRAFLWGQIAITAIQLMTHYSNDYFDLVADVANRTPTHWSGGSRVLPARQLPARVALITAVLLSLVAMVAVLMLTVEVRTGVLTAPLIGLGWLLSWFYSAPPLRLHSRGVGEVATAMIVPGLTPLVAYYLQAGRIDPLPLLASFPLCCFQFAMLLTIEIPDEQGDAAVGKRTLVVRLGAARAARLHRVAIVLAYASLPILVLLGLPLLAALSLLVAAPFAVRQVWTMGRGAWAQPGDWNRMGFLSVALLIGSAGLELLAFALLIGLR
jgi:1,4-dihydroxy-2-naphthoate octaprenyltransferase